MEANKVKYPPHAVYFCYFFQGRKCYFKDSKLQVVRMYYCICLSVRLLVRDTLSYIQHLIIQIL